jgi:dTDP-4-dehydrorhamnose reductase
MAAAIVSNMPPILLIGHDGQVGFELQRTLAALGPVRAACYPDVDFVNPDSIVRLVRETQPGLIVNAAAYTAVDKAEAEPDLCRRLNADAPRILAEEARKLGAALVHYSTDFVHDGEQRRPYTETDVPYPLNVYGRTKLDGDLAIAATGVPHLIFRIAWVYGMRGKNFLLTVRRLAGEGKPLRIVDDQVGCPTWCRSVAETTAAALRVFPSADALRDVSGVYHAVCGGETSWCGFARACVPAETVVQPITTADYPTPARRPAYGVLDCGKLQRVFNLALPRWRDALDTCLRE